MMAPRRLTKEQDSWRAQANPLTVPQRTLEIKETIAAAVRPTRFFSEPHGSRGLKHTATALVTTITEERQMMQRQLRTTNQHLENQARCQAVALLAIVALILITLLDLSV